MTIEDRMVESAMLNIELPRQVDVRVPSISGGTERRRPTTGTRVSWAEAQPFVPTQLVAPVSSIHRWRPLERSRRRPARWRQVYAVRAVVGDAAMCVGVLAPVLTTLSLTAAMTVLATLCCAVGWVLALVVNRGYDGRRLGSGPDEFQSVIRSTWLMVAVFAIAAYTTHTSLPRRVVFVSLPVVGVLTALLRHLLRRHLHRERDQGRSMLQTLVVGDVAAVGPLVDDLGREAYHGYRVIGVCVPSDPFGGSAQLAVDSLGTVGDVPQVVVDHDVDVVIVAGSQLTGQSLRRLSWALDRVGADLVVSPGVVEVAGPHVSVRPAAGLSLLHLEQPSRHLGRELGKTVLDRVLGTLLLLLAAVPLALMALAVLVTSPGSAFFRQERAGVEGRPFTMWKLRTMVTDAESSRIDLLGASDRDGPMFKMRRDPRVTPIGRILRRFSFDELPQLWNVVRGDMSLVGPRPPLMSEVEQYHDAVNRRLRVRPGLTGLWQVSGRADLSWDESIDLDLRYVDNWSLALDLQILWKTARAVAGGSGAY